MRYLIDTNILLWFAEKNDQLPEKILNVLLDDSIDIFVSMASIWEISIKYSLQKLELPCPLVTFIDEIRRKYDFLILPIWEDHILKQASLPFHHRDPFDRLIYAQSAVEKMEFLYTDEIFDMYRSK